MVLQKQNSHSVIPLRPPRAERLQKGSGLAEKVPRIEDIRANKGGLVCATICQEFRQSGSSGQCEHILSNCRSAPLSPLFPTLGDTSAAEGFLRETLRKVHPKDLDGVEAY